MTPTDRKPVEEQAGVDSMSSRSAALYACRGCKNIAVVFDDEEVPACHGKSMRPVSDIPLSVAEPDVGTVLHELFGMPEPAGDIYARFSDGGLKSTAELADELGYDRDTVRTTLDRLVAAGFLEQARLNRESDGFITVYRTPDPDTLEQHVRTAVSEWAMNAATALTGLPGTESTEPP